MIKTATFDEPTIEKRFIPPSLTNVARCDCCHDEGPINATVTQQGATRYVIALLCSQCIGSVRTPDEIPDAMIEAGREEEYDE